MGIKRIVDTDFWTDDKVVDMFSPEDKLFFLYLMTNPHTTQLGIYPLNKKVMAFELGYSLEAVGVLLDRFETKYNVIRYSPETSEIAIRNYLRHSIIKGGKPVEDLLMKEISKVKNKKLISFVRRSILTDPSLNNTVRDIFINLNDNDNENDVSYHDTSHDTYHVSLEDFEKFWSAYPKKKDKANAEKAFKRVKVPVSVLLDAIEKQKKSEDWKKEGGKFIPYPTTWLNGKRWEDEDITLGRKAFDITDPHSYDDAPDEGYKLEELLGGQNGS